MVNHPKKTRELASNLPIKWLAITLGFLLFASKLQVIEEEGIVQAQQQDLDEQDTGKGGT